MSLNFMDIEVLLWQYTDYQHSHSKHSYKYWTEIYYKYMSLCSVIPNIVDPNCHLVFDDIFWYCPAHTCYRNTGWCSLVWEVLVALKWELHVRVMYRSIMATRFLNKGSAQLQHNCVPCPSVSHTASSTVYTPHLVTRPYWYSNLSLQTSKLSNLSLVIQLSNLSLQTSNQTQ